MTSRNLDLLLEQEGNTFVDVAKASGLFECLERFAERHSDCRIAIRGELLGPNIQGNIYQLTKHIFHIFDIWINGSYLTPEERVDFIFEWLAEHCNPNVVQCARGLFICSPSEMTVQEIVDKANGQSELYPTPREGLVFKSAMLYNGDVFSFKAISPEYLLKEKE